MRLIPEKFHQADGSLELSELRVFVDMTHRAGIRPKLPFTLVRYRAFINDCLFGLDDYLGDCIVLRMPKERRRRFSNRIRFRVSHSQTTMTFHPSKHNCF